ncbi:hypothetical protein SLH46_00075 [Draconibacterium sp. IB214405]|uniref:sugar-binding domain-containing protein n=1 Tax=Draconibacterium sp. IB214405 TaxID=3097352 RepID=UPI002A17A83F|nr:sugar-binding domain-containing protein [Draconibacterium sp. IB214405]MDX8337554.1 hypothetical protein [Draconibacterium sp. IB214405]
MLKRTKIWSFALLLFTAIFMNCNVHDNKIISKQLFDLNWKFISEDSTSTSTSAFEIDYDDSNWQNIDLPHKWNNDLESVDSVWYRKHFIVPENWINKHIVLYFEGISEQNEIRINGNPVENSLKANNSFQAPINSYLNGTGANVIAVRIEKSNQQNDLIYAESGIFKHAWLVISNRSNSK